MMWRGPEICVFLKRHTRKKDGKTHTYWDLVESYRTPRGCRHRPIAYLGELSASEKKGWARLATMLDGRAAASVEHLSLFETSSDDSEVVPDHVQVDLGAVRVENTRDFGDVFLALAAWRALGLDELLERELPRGREDVPWPLVACIIACARFLEPSSELHIEDTWFRRTALPELLGVEVDDIDDHRLYRALDRVLPLKTAIEAHLKDRVGRLFHPDVEFLLYDVTSTYFEGEARANPKAKRGHSRDHRPDCKQVCVGLVVTVEGFPLGYEEFAGNTHDAKTLRGVVEAMEKKYGKAKRIWVIDRGIVSEENLEFLRERGGLYLVATPRRQLKHFERELRKGKWKEIREDIAVKLVPPKKGRDTYVLCRSGDRRVKEQAMHERFLARIQEGLASIERCLRRAKKPRDRDETQRRLGRLLARNTRAQKAFTTKLVDDPKRASGLRLRVRRRKKWAEWAKATEGCYLLRTNISDKTPEQLWHMYMQLTDVEEAFRTGKSELALRPIWHRREKRVSAHILFSFLAYAMWKTVQEWMDRAGLGRGVRTVIEELAKIKTVDVLLGTSKRRDVKLACVARPDDAQRALLDRLGLQLPERLCRPQWLATKVEM
jgi:transposase